MWNHFCWTPFVVHVYYPASGPPAPTWVGVTLSLSPHDGNRSCLRNVMFQFYFKRGRWPNSKHRMIQNVIYHRQKADKRVPPPPFDGGLLRRRKRVFATARVAVICIYPIWYKVSVRYGSPTWSPDLLTWPSLLYRSQEYKTSRYTHVCTAVWFTEFARQLRKTTGTPNTVHWADTETRDGWAKMSAWEPI